MSFWRVFSLICCLAPLHGCTPQPESQADDQKDPFFLQGRRLVTERDFKGAVDSFEKALEQNPHFVLAHYELGLLYETKINEPATALYHYKQVVRFQPNGHPAEIVLARIKGCEQEIAKNVALVQVDPAVMAELERLKEENRRLLVDLETLRTLVANPVAVFTNPPPTQSTRDVRPERGPDASTARSTPNGLRTAAIRNPTTNTFITPSNRTSGTGPPPSVSRAKGVRTVHYVRSHETFSSIARQYRVSMASLRVANPSISPERLKVGQPLNIPAS